MFNKKRTERLIKEINQHLQIKPINISWFNNNSVRVHIRRINTLHRILRYVDLIEFPDAKVDNIKDHYWLDLISFDKTVFITYHI